MKLLLVLVVVATASSQAAVYESIPSVSGVLCQLFLGDIPLCPASSCKEIADTRLGNSRSGFYWVTSHGRVHKSYCGNEPLDQSQGWTKIGNISSECGCPVGLEQLTAGSRKLCRKTVDIGCSSVTFPTNGASYSKVCGRVYGYQKDTTDGFERHTHCDDCTIDQQYVDGVSITHGSPRQHIWTLAASYHAPYCQCDGHSSVPSFIGDDFFCNGDGTNTFSLNDRLWDGHSCLPGTEQCCDRANWFCKDLPQSTTDNIEFRLCTDEARSNEDVYIEDVEIYVQ